MQCVILAGGLGTRMRPFTDRLPKTLLPVNGEPFAAHQLRWLSDEGVTDVVYCIGRHGHLVRDFVGDGGRWGLRMRYVQDGPSLLGTGGALRKALDEEVLAPAFLTLYGDSYLPIRLDPVVDAFTGCGLPALMTVLGNDGEWDTSNAVFDGRLVTLYDKRADPRPPEMRYIDYGLSVLTANLVRQQIPPAEVVDLSDVFHRLSTERQLAGHEVKERFFEIGSPEGLRALEEHLGRSCQS